MENSTLKNILVIDITTRSFTTLFKSFGRMNAVNSTLFRTTESTFPLSIATTNFYYPPDRAFLPKPEISLHSSSIAKRPMIFSVYASVIKPLPKPSVPAYNN